MKRAFPLTTQNTQQFNLLDPTLVYLVLAKVTNLNQKFIPKRLNLDAVRLLTAAACITIDM